MTEPFPVLVVGGGPVGLTVALGIAQAGIPVVVIERAELPSTEWRASTFHPPTLEWCARLGIVDEMIEQGLVAETFQIRGWDEGTVVEFNLGVIADATKYPFRLQLEQYKYSNILREHLSKLDHVDLRYGTRFDTADDATDHVVAHMSTSAGPEDISAHWLVAADGASSAVRQHLDIPFEGLTYPNKHLILSVDAPLTEWYPDLSYVNYISGVTDHPGMLLKIPDLWRVSFGVDDDVPDDIALSDEFVDARMSAIFSPNPYPVPVARQIFKVHQRVADKLRIGRTLLAGDAGHVNSPRGGMGLNGGIHDAADLTAVLAGVIDGSVDDRALDAWATRRRTVALEHIREITHRYTTEMKESDKQGLVDSFARYQAIAADEGLQRAFLLESSMLASVADQRSRLGATF